MLKLVPHTLREASLGLGAPEWTTSLSVVLPAALNGVITGFLLAISRAAGETAPLLFTALGNERYDLGLIIRNGIAQKLGFIDIFNRIINQPADSLPLTIGSGHRLAPCMARWNEEFQFPASSSDQF